MSEIETTNEVDKDLANDEILDVTILEDGLD